MPFVYHVANIKRVRICIRMNDNGGTQLLVEVRAKPSAYVMVLLACSSPALIWLVSVFQGKNVPVQVPAFSVAGVIFMALFLKNLSIRLDEAGISQGFSVLRTFLPYETVSGVHREVRRGRGGSTTVLVITKRDSRKRIVILLRSFDQVKLAQAMDVLARKSPQAHIEDALHSPFKT